MGMEDLNILDRHFRLANYLASAQLYLLDNPLLERPLIRSDIKRKIVGHWGTVAGQNFVYTHLNRAINKYGSNIALLSGPGHGGNFFVANSYIEGTYTEIYPEITKNKTGLQKLFKIFSFPCGISSHVAPEVPGSMHEGGELGYSLAHGFGAVLDNPKLITAVIVGDGEAETGPLATSWWGTKFLNKKTDGAVLPILHLNGYKISNPTLLARISEEERKKYFEGLGYDVIEIKVGEKELNILEDHKKMAEAIDYCIEKINSRSSNPMIILNSPKGWTGPAEANGKKITGTFNAHQVPVDMSKLEHIKIVEDWLKSYKHEELINADGTIKKDILDFCPKGDKRISGNPVTYGGKKFIPLKLPDVKKFFIDTKDKAQDMLVLSNYVAEVFKLNPNSFRFFTPDEAKSNRLYAPFNVTKRAWQADMTEQDEDLSREGRIIDSILSEHMCEGMLEGYTLTGRHGFFATYESFARVIDSMLNQHSKWIKQIKHLKWRTPLPALNLIATSHTWQQDHNGFSHQDTGVAAHLLDKDNEMIRCYYPADANSLLAVFNKCMNQENIINLITASKHPSYQWRSGEQAESDIKNGISVWQEQENPDIVLACLGDTPTLECMAAMKIMKDKLPDVKVRLVNVLDLGKLGGRSDSLNDAEYQAIFTNDKPVVFVSHTYKNIILALTSPRPNSKLYSVLAYSEEGAITTGFDMRVLNGIDRFNIIKTISNNTVKDDSLVKEMDAKLKEHRAYIKEYGVDPDWVTQL